MRIQTNRRPSKPSLRSLRTLVPPFTHLALPSGPRIGLAECRKNHRQGPFPREPGSSAASARLLPGAPRRAQPLPARTRRAPPAPSCVHAATPRHPACHAETCVNPRLCMKRSSGHCAPLAIFFNEGGYQYAVHDDWQLENRVPRKSVAGNPFPLSSSGSYCVLSVLLEPVCMCGWCVAGCLRLADC